MADSGHPRRGPDRYEARILVIDDEDANIQLLERILDRAGYRNVVSTNDPRRTSDLFASFEPDVILLDLLMPHLDGFEVMRILGAMIQPSTYLPILVLTADSTPSTRRRALGSGARDFLTKPFDVDEVVLRIANMVDARFLHLELKAEKELLDERVKERTRELSEAYVETFERLAVAAEFRDDETGQHTRRVGRVASIIADQMRLPSSEVELLRSAAALHDIGKLGVPDSILLAPRRLTAKEFEVVKTHTTIGASILSGSRSPILGMAEQIAASHHESWDGSGYHGLVGEDIPLVGRITSVADVFDALTHERPYKPAWAVDEAIGEIERLRGRKFDPEVVDAFMSAIEHVVETADLADIWSRLSSPLLSLQTNDA